MTEAEQYLAACEASLDEFDLDLSYTEGLTRAEFDKQPANKPIRATVRFVKSMVIEKDKLEMWPSPEAAYKAFSEMAERNACRVVIDRNGDLLILRGPANK